MPFFSRKRALPAVCVGLATAKVHKCCDIPGNLLWYAAVSSLRMLLFHRENPVRPISACLAVLALC
ncbi:MAG TPA: hypothetical protein VGE70_00030, partial [Burkholderiaceae bacterium]